MKNKLYIYLMALMALTACSDELISESIGGETADGMALSISVVEQGDMTISAGNTTRSASDIADSYRFESKETTGYMDSIKVHRMPLPYVGIHRAAVGSQETSTRASTDAIVSTQLNFHDSLSVWGYVDGGTNLFGTNNSGVIVKKVRGWRTSVLWPTSGTKMQFYAIAPALECLEDLELTNTPAYGTVPTFSFTVPSDTAAQRDLVYGTGTATISTSHTVAMDDKTVDMTFQHILTAIRFAQGKMPTGVTVKSMTLTGVKNKGTYTPTPTPSTGWSSLDGSADYTINTSHNVTVYDAPENTYIDNGQVLFLMPQTVPSGATLSIVVNDAKGDHTLSVSIADDEWNAGYTVTYKITVGKLSENYYLLIDNSLTKKENLLEFGTTSGSFDIHSYRKYNDYSSSSTPTVTYKPAKWHITGFSTNDNSDYTEVATPSNLTYTAAHPSWITAITGWNVSSTASQEVTPSAKNHTLSYTLSSQAVAYTAEHSKVLKNNYNASYVDLSLYTPNGSGFTSRSRTTANCYIVNSQGTYTFPMVYGNAITNGVEQTSFNDIFVDHAGTKIQYAWIPTQLNTLHPAADDVLKTVAEGTSEVQTLLYSLSVSIDDDRYTSGAIVKRTTHESYALGAELLWQDVSGLFTAVSCDASNVSFTVSSTPQPGNGVIGLKRTKTTTVSYTVYNSSGVQIGEVVPGTETSISEYVWSWHIWVTDEVYPNTTTNVFTRVLSDDPKHPITIVDEMYPSYNGSTTKIVNLLDADGNAVGNILPVNLGWVPDNDTWNYYAPRETWAKIKQTVGDAAPVYVRIRQEATPELQTGASTVYQWGRPTALPMIKTVANADRSVYNLSGTDIRSNFTVASFTAVQDAFTNPIKMGKYSTTYDWWNRELVKAYWTNGGLYSAKTLYDPCPPDFCMPVNDMFKWFSMTGASADGTNLNVYDTNYANSSKGAYFFAKAHSSSPAITELSTVQQVYMPISGFYTPESAGSAPAYTTGGSYLWNSDGTGAAGKYLYILPDKIASGAITLGDTKSYGMSLPVRPSTTKTIVTKPESITSLSKERK